MDQDQAGIHRIAHDMLSVEDAYMYDTLEDNIVHFDSQMQVDENAWYGRDESSYVDAKGAAVAAGNDATAAVMHQHATFSTALYSGQHDDNHHHNGSEGHMNYEYHDAYEQPFDERYSTGTYVSEQPLSTPPWWDASPHFPALHLVMIRRDEKWFHLGTEIWARRGAEPTLPFVTDFESDRVVTKKDFNVTAADVKQSIAARQEMFSHAGSEGDGKQQRRRKTKPAKAPTSNDFSARVRRTTGIASWIIAYLDANAPHHLQDYSTGSEALIFVTFTTEAHLSLLIELISVYAKEEAVQERQSFIDTHHYNFQRGDDTTASESIASFDFTDSSATVSYEHGDDLHLDANNAPPEVNEADVRERTSKWFARLISFPMLQCWRLLSHAQSLPYPSSSDAPFYTVKWWEGIVDLLNLNDKWVSSSTSLVASDDRVAAQQRQRDKKRRGRRVGGTLASSAVALLSAEEVAAQRDAEMARFLYRKTRIAYTSRSVPWMMWDASPPVSSLSMTADVADAGVVADTATGADVADGGVIDADATCGDAANVASTEPVASAQNDTVQRHTNHTDESSFNASMDVTLVTSSCSPSSDADVVQAMEAIAIDNPNTLRREEEAAATDTGNASQSPAPPTAAVDIPIQSSSLMIVDSTVDLSSSVSSPARALTSNVLATTTEENNKNKRKKNTSKKDRPPSRPDTIKRQQQRPKSPSRPRPPRKGNTGVTRRRVNLSQSAPIDRPASTVSESDQTPSLSCSSSSVISPPSALSMSTSSSIRASGDTPSETSPQHIVCAIKSLPDAAAAATHADDSQQLLPRHTPATAGLSMGCKAPMACFVAPILTSNGKRMGGGFLFGNRPIVK